MSNLNRYSVAKLGKEELLRFGEILAFTKMVCVTASVGCSSGSLEQRAPACPPSVVIPFGL